MNVRWNKRALTELRAAHGWIKRENPPAAKEFLEAVAGLVDLLGEYPAMGVRTDEPKVLMFSFGPLSLPDLLQNIARRGTPDYSYSPRFAKAAYIGG